jgi:hypothetical protein
VADVQQPSAAPIDRAQGTIADPALEAASCLGVVGCLSAEQDGSPRSPGFEQSDLVEARAVAAHERGRRRDLAQRTGKTARRDLLEGARAALGDPRQEQRPIAG